MYVRKGVILYNKEVAENIYKMSISCLDIASIAKPGQFLHIRVSNQCDPLLRRPISIFYLDETRGNMELLYKVLGKGTRILSQKGSNETLDILGPLGNGFPIVKDKKAAIIGGGMGIAPLLELSKHLLSPDIYLGFKDTVFATEEFLQYTNKLYIFTEDGSQGIKGYPTSLLSDNIEKYDLIYTCGPKPMMKAVKKLCEEKGVECYLSMEENMGCGIGACYVCSCKSNVDGIYKRVCIDGPVFNSKEVSFDD